MKKFLILAAVAISFSAAGLQASTLQAPAMSEVAIVSSDSDWDSVLNSYEKFVDQYIKTYKKAVAGDAEALASYPSLLKKAQDLQNKLNNASDDMTDAQLQRYIAITNKLSKALQSVD